MDNLAFADGEFYIESKNSKKEKTIDDKIYTFDEAVTISGNGKFQSYLAIICGICFMAVMVEIMGISMVIDQAQCDLNFTIYEKGFLSSAGFIGVVLSSHVMGFLADTCGRVKLLKYALFLSLISSIISIFSISVWMLAAFRFLVGLFISGCQACVFSFVGEFHSNKSRVRSITLLSCFLPLGLVFLPLLALIIAPLNIEFFIGTLKITSWRIVLLANVLPSLIGFIGLQFLPESPKFLMIQGKYNDALNVLKYCYSINTGQNMDNYPVKKIETDITGGSFSNVKSVSDALKLIWLQTIPLFYRERVFHTLNILIVYFIIFIVAQGLFMWFPSILSLMVKNINEDITICQSLNYINSNSNNDSLNSTSTTNICVNQGVNVSTYQFLIVMGFIYTCIYLLFSFIINIVGKKRLLVIWLAICGFATLGLYWAKNFYLNLILFTLTMAVGNGGGIINTITIEFFPTNVSAMGMCLLMMIGRLGAVAGSNIVGIILSSNCELLFLVFGCLIILLVPLSYLFPSRR